MKLNAGFDQHFFGVFRTKAVLHEFSNVILATLFVALAGSSGFGSPNRDERPDRFMEAFVIGVNFGADIGVGVEVFQKNFPSDDFGQPEVKGLNGVEKFLAPAKFSPVVEAETGGDLVLSGIGGFDGYHTQFWFLVSSNRLVGKNEIRSTRKSYQSLKFLQFQNQPNFITA